MKRLLLLALAAASAAHASSGRVKGSKHDLSSTGPGVFRAQAESSPCIFCHVSHLSGPGLTNRPDPANQHRPYESSTVSTRPGAPTGASRICLSCHDGTIALGKTLRGKIDMAGPTHIGPERRSHLGTDLRSSHPVSFRPGSNGRTRSPPPDDAVRLDRSGQVQCTSCHDPHDEFGDPDVGKFLVKPSRGSALCTTCHDASLDRSAHASSTAPIGPAEGGAFRTVRDAGCGACHGSHGADVNGRLLKPGRTDDETCLACHGRGVTRPSIAPDLAKQWAHASRSRGDHDAAEGREGHRPLPERSAATPRHVACVDCHDPHAARVDGGVAPAVRGTLAGAWGVDLEGRRVEPARFEYEICLKCHGDSANRPEVARGALGGARRALDDANLRRVFDPSAPSFHPVAAPGRNPLVPSLRPPLGVGSFVYCTDCHASDSGPGAGGIGARGPHGSSFPSLLERRYSTADLVPETPAAYALCYKCHRREVLLSPSSGFPLHAEHLSIVGPGSRPTPCATCHDAHGVSSNGGNDRENAHLIDFDLQVVRPGASGRARYEALGPGRGSCALTCHGVEHDPGIAVEGPGRVRGVY